MQLFYAPEIAPPTYTLTEEESRHCIRVLRMGAGDTLHITDGQGNIHKCCITVADARHCQVSVVKTTTDFEPLPYSLTMAVAPTKNIERFEWFLEKATEVGVDCFIPLECAHSERKVVKLDRAMRVISSAMKQSLKAYHPRLEEMTPFKTLVTQPFDGVKLIAHCHRTHEEPIFLPKALGIGGKVLILIGPEGDFSPEEVALAEASGFRAISLGRSRLRTETAGLCAGVMVSAHNQG